MNPYIRAIEQFPEIKAQAVAALELRQQEEAAELVRARDDMGRFVADDPSTPENEAWTEVTT